MRWVDTLAQKTIDRHKFFKGSAGVYPSGTLYEYNLRGLDLTGIQDIATALLKCSGENLEAARITQRQADALSEEDIHHNNLCVIDAEPEKTDAPSKATQENTRELIRYLDKGWERRFNALRQQQNYAAVDLSAYKMDENGGSLSRAFNLQNVTLHKSVCAQWIRYGDRSSFNDYRRANPNILPDLSGLDAVVSRWRDGRINTLLKLSGFDLSGLDLREVGNLEMAQGINQANITGAIVTPQQKAALEVLANNSRPSAESLASLVVTPAVTKLPAPRVIGGGGAQKVLQDKIRGLV